MGAICRVRSTATTNAATMGTGCGGSDTTATMGAGRKTATNDAATMGTKRRIRSTYAATMGAVRNTATVDTAATGNTDTTDAGARRTKRGVTRIIDARERRR